jgi:alpha-L-rhamnosidase
VFSDSLEVFASDWTPDLLDEFRKRRGYDLTPYLPALVGDIGGKTSAVRHDWGQTLTELGEDRYLTPIANGLGITAPNSAPRPTARRP